MDQVSSRSLNHGERSETMGLEPKPSLRAEIVIGFLVLILAMGFRLAPLPVAGTEHVPMTHLQKGTLMVMVVPSAVPPGSISFTLHVSDAKPGFAPQEVSLSLTDPVAGIGPIKAETEAIEDQWRIKPVTLPTAGPWVATITVLKSDFEQVKMEGEIRLRD
jgi:copper transport protein